MKVRLKRRDTSAKSPCSLGSGAGIYSTCNAGLQNSGEAKLRSKKQLITTDMVLKKCLEYHTGRISAQQLVDWLSFVILSPIYRMEQRLRITIVNMIDSLSSCLRHDDLLAFDQVLTEFENGLNRQ